MPALPERSGSRWRRRFCCGASRMPIARGHSSMLPARRSRSREARYGSGRSMPCRLQPQASIEPWSGPRPASRRNACRGSRGSSMPRPLMTAPQRPSLTGAAAGKADLANRAAPGPSISCHASAQTHDDLEGHFRRTRAGWSSRAPDRGVARFRRPLPLRSCRRRKRLPP
jgi:hypothetical protein